MASTKRLLKERAKLARDPIPYVSFHDEDDNDDDEAMTDAAGINEWRFVLALDPAHDSLDEASEIGRAADSPYCRPPPSLASSSSSSSSSGKKSGGILSGVARAAKSSKKSSGDMANSSSSTSAKTSSSSSSGDPRPAYFAFQLDFPPNYPFKPPTITVLGVTHHPNVKKDSGAMCDHVLTGDGWGPTLNVKKICMRLRKFLCEPDPGHPLEAYMAQMLVEKPGDYAIAAHKHAVEHATRAKAEEAMARGKGGKK